MRPGTRSTQVLFSRAALTPETSVSVSLRLRKGTGDSVFAGFYLPGDDFGWVSVRFSTA